MSTSLVSVVIPAFNSERWIAEAIESALGQQNCQVEVIVVDDGSTDSTESVVKSFGDRVRYVHQENAGPAAARNRGVAAASYEWIAFLDADDVWHPEKICQQITTAASGDFDVVYTNVRNFGAEDRVAELRLSPTAMPTGDILAELLLDNFITLSSVLIRRNLFFETGGFREEFFGTEDWDFWLRLASQRVRFGSCPEPLVEYRWVTSSVSKNHKRMKLLRQRTLDSALQSLDDHAVAPEIVRQAYANMYATSSWFIEESDPRQALRWTLQSLLKWPHEKTQWKNMARQTIKCAAELTTSSSCGSFKVA